MGFFFFFFTVTSVSLPHVITQLFAGLLLADFRVSNCITSWVGREEGPHTVLSHTLISQISIQFTLLTTFSSKKKILELFGL